MPYKLLLADDSVTIQRVVELTLADEDVEVTAVGDGQEAMNQILRDRPDIVLADVDMPKRDGYEVAAFIKDDPALGHIPVLLLTGAFELVDEARARAVRCDGVLAKPFEPQLLIGRVRELLGRAAVSPSGAAEEGHSMAAGGGQHVTPPDTPGVPERDDLHMDLGSLEFRPESTAQPETSLDDYFDRLDAAFAHLTGAPPSHDSAPAARPADGGPAEPAFVSPHDRPGVSAVASAAAESASTPVAGGEPVTSVPGAGLPVSDAFAALLDAEQMFGPDAVHGGERQPDPTAVREVAVDDALIDDIARRVTERIGETALREAVANVVVATAERLIREEIERLKATIK
jgi:CheY-like chemotaxis protein